ncbi:uncharacterized protein LACBIDRAFT_300426 [Laccaria bicolor S238N-H82]|uniref:Predicted protein n=1 Tax=Laccaria bicolor (strain S238N-H82 / ATCC MYA-4686) TaxID=486041 RepID=B0DGR3_LACBS|nr:uncharacterized protein LACBIDRAFT_300426 [Laccaria bicolor S238N-H82]EDR06197.1 predicted protein [Laccaria bicolor S238N-H82]|eukprot:XP_001883058.1 predicted protein [Laccaria bicolor S238N-H82]
MPHPSQVPRCAQDIKRVTAPMSRTCYERWESETRKHPNDHEPRCTQDTKRESTALGPFDQQPKKVSTPPHRRRPPSTDDDERPLHLGTTTTRTTDDLPRITSTYG